MSVESELKTLDELAMAHYKYVYYKNKDPVRADEFKSAAERYKSEFMKTAELLSRKIGELRYTDSGAMTEVLQQALWLANIQAKAFGAPTFRIEKVSAVHVPV